MLALDEERGLFKNSPKPKVAEKPKLVKTPPPPKENKPKPQPEPKPEEPEPDVTAEEVE